MATDRMQTDPERQTDKASKAIDKQMKKMAKTHGPPTPPRPMPVIPSDILRILGDPPLFPGESGADFNSLLTRMAVDVEPTDIIEWIWVHNVTVLAWEVMRLRRLRANMLRDSHLRQLQRTLQSATLATGTNSTHEQVTQMTTQLAYDWASGYNVKDTVAEFLRGTTETADSVSARVVLGYLTQIERIDRMIDTAMARYNAILREMDRKRESFARRMRKTSSDIVDSETIPQADEMMP